METLPFIVTIMFIFGFNTFQADQNIADDYCNRKPKVTKMFTSGGKVYFGSGMSSSSGYDDLLYSFDLTTKTLRHSISPQVEFGKLINITAPVELVVHFDPVHQCLNTESNVAFCERSKVFTDMVVLVSGGRAIVYSYSSSSSSAPYGPYSHTAEFETQSSILPLINSRLYASIYMLFSQVANNEMIHFTGATYDQFEDALFLTATIIPDSVVNDQSWNVGKYVMFRSSFYPNGLLQDAFVVTDFREPVNGLIDYNGVLYALTASGSIVAVINDTVGNIVSVPSALIP